MIRMMNRHRPPKSTTQTQKPQLTPPHAMNKAAALLHITKERGTTPLNHSPYLKEYWSDHPDDKQIGSQGPTYDTIWTHGSIIHQAGTYNKDTTKATRWAIASAQHNTTPTTTVISFQEHHKAAYKQFLTHPLVHNLGTIQFNKMLKPNHWQHPPTEQECTPPKRHTTRLLLVANEVGLQRINATDWVTFTQTLAKHGTTKLTPPPPTGHPSPPPTNTFKPPRAFQNLCTPTKEDQKPTTPEPTPFHPPPHHHRTNPASPHTKHHHQTGRGRRDPDTHHHPHPYHCTTHPSTCTTYTQTASGSPTQTPRTLD